MTGRFSFNQATATGWALPDLVAGCRDAGVDAVGLWREPVAEFGLDRAARLVRDAGITVSTLCRGGFFTTGEDWYDDNRRALDEAAALGAPVLVLVSGGMAAGDRDLAGARDRVADAVAALAPHAADAGVTLAIEPLHPMFAADRCVISTLGQALDIATRFDPATVGVVVDAYHLWWDDRVYADIARAGAHIASFQVCDWITPLPAGVLLGRALPGEGCIELRRMRAAVDAAGYRGPIEVEVFNAELWDRPGREILAAALEGYRRHVA
ncbi:sugar phosphate isomerase/epimerase [Plantactinospora sp. KBS50]|uniref:sugar phosphate isomerase/epimerase family protein n=1 Tax=Plantactinospora sp. KBS50 TaxID=2024580 RepID=UPI000BAAFF0A|nr:sugar phosphate isomerase/epimerase family protein [Plantactinospora sp. KBS50]ASW54885.1 sugar phosphate isomerase [Plantactinospora sp. KBS50]